MLGRLCYTGCAGSPGLLHEGVVNMPEKMRALVKPGRAPGMEMTLVNVPPVGRREALIRVKACCICGTDLHIYRWDPWAQNRVHPPIIQGHEFCGNVVETGADVTEVKIGDYVSAESHITCGVCSLCRSGRAHVCQNTQIIGVDRDGCWADYIVLPASNLWHNPPGMPLEIASLQENFGNAVHTAFACELPTRTVLVTGCGPVGLMAIAIAKAAGAQAVYATDISPYRLDLARVMGADLALNPAEVDVIGAIRERTGPEGVDVLLEMSGAPAGIDLGFHLLKFGGEAALLGLTPAPMIFDLDKHITLKGARVYGIAGRKLWDTWFRIRALLDTGLVDLQPLITHRYNITQHQEAMATMASGLSGKVVMFTE
jgi:threonine 3-dehydrogenase